ncbi:MAG: hypothetical protein ACPGVS_01035 [Primorskyibacter sp.]
MTGLAGVAIFAAMRTGSNYLEEGIASRPGFHAWGELFNPHFMGSPGCETLLGMSLRQRDQEPDALLERIETQDGTPVLRLFDDHDTRARAAIVHRRGWRIVVLRRNLLDSFLSLQIARQTDQWRLRDARHQRQVRIRFDPAAFNTYCQDRKQCAAMVDLALQSSVRTPICVAYERMRSQRTWDRVADGLGLTRAPRPRPNLVRQNPGAPWDKVSNPQDLPPDVRLGPATLRAAHTPLSVVLGDVTEVALWQAELDGAPPVRDAQPNTGRVGVYLRSPLVRAQQLWGGADRATFIARMRAARRCGHCPPAQCKSIPLGAKILRTSDDFKQIARACGHPNPPTLMVPSPNTYLDTPRIRRLVRAIWPQDLRLWDGGG